MITNTTKKLALGKIYKKGFCTLLKNPFEHNLDISSYNDFFRKYGLQQYNLYKSGVEKFDPNLSDQCCQLRAFWAAEKFKKIDDANMMEEEDLITFGQGALISKCTPHEINSFQIINKWIDVEKATLEEILGEPLSNKKFVKFFSALKSIFSQKVSEELVGNHIKHWDVDVKSDLLYHFSNQLFFSQKNKKLPFIPIFTAGYAFDKLIELNEDVPVVLLYRHFLANKNGEIYLNGIKIIPVHNQRLNGKSQLLSKDDENVVVVEAYSCSYIDVKNSFELSFYKNSDFDRVVQEMEQQFHFTEAILCCEALHNLYHQIPKKLVKGEIKDYLFDDYSEAYEQKINFHKKLGKQKGLGVNYWNPHRGKYLNEDIPFDLFHINCTTIHNLKMSAWSANKIFTKDKICSQPSRRRSI